MIVREFPDIKVPLSNTLLTYTQWQLQHREINSTENGGHGIFYGRDWYHEQYGRYCTQWRNFTGKWNNEDN